MCLGEITQLPVIELDMVFWRPGIAATPRDQWVIVQEKHVAEDGWIMDGELGPYDGVEVRLRAVDTAIFLDSPFCAVLDVQSGGRASVSTSGGGSWCTAGRVARLS
jgi:hypothetical protein